MERLHSHTMNRRSFLKVAGAVASIEIGRQDEVGDGDDAELAAGEEDLPSLARSLPTASGLAVDDGIEYAVTRLDADVATISEATLADATAFATVFAGPTAVDIAVGLPNAQAVRDRLLADGYDVLGTQRGWTVLDRGARTRHRTAAVADSAAVLGASPVPAAVRNDVRAVMRAVAEEPEIRPADVEVRDSVLDHLGAGTHLSVDATPDPRKTAGSVVATGERYALGQDRTTVRSVTMFESVAGARAADLDDIRGVPGPSGTVGSVDRRGRAIIRDATVPSDRFVALP